MKKSIEQNLQIQEELEPIATQALSLEITDNSSLKEATSILSRLNQYNDNIQEEKEKITKPLNEALKAERSRWKPLETMYNDAIEAIRAKMATYQTNLVNSTKAKEQSIANRIGTGRGKLSLEKAIEQIETLPSVIKTTSTEEGSVVFVETKILKVTDLSLIPDEYWQLNDKELLADLKKGITIPGAEIEIIQTPRNNR